MTSFEPYLEYRDSEAEIALQMPGGETIFIRIGPGRAFGSEHPTTRLCKRGIEEAFKRRAIETGLDIGCGSGILAIATAALGAESVLALDIDPDAVKETRENAARNRLSSKIRVIKGSVEKAFGQFDLVTANLSPNELIRIESGIREAMNEDGVLIASGISIARKEKVLADLDQAGFIFKREYREGGWLAIWFELKK